MKLAALVSGGKDSVFALQKMLEEGHDVVSMVCLVPENPESYMFHSVNMSLVPAISEASGIPVLMQKTSGIKEEELNELRSALSRLISEKGIEGVCCGAIESTYQKSRVEKICEELGIRAFCPLWHRDAADLVSEMIGSGMEIIFASVAADGFDESWLGRHLDTTALDELVRMNQKYYVHIAGEGGEFETAVLDAPFFRKKIVIVRSERVWMKDHGEIRLSELETKEKNV